MRLFIFLLLLLVVIPSAMADLDPTKITFSQVPSEAYVDDFIRLEGQLTYEDGSEITVGYMDIARVGIYINNELYVKTQCNATGHFGGWYKLDVVGSNTIKAVFEDKPGMNLEGCESSILINVMDRDTTGPSSAGLTNFISYAKGFFALVFFSVLGITLGMGCYSAYTNDPQKKADSYESLFALLKIITTVAILYITVLFLSP